MNLNFSKVNFNKYQWRFYLEARGAKPPKSWKKKDLAPKFQGRYIIFFAGVVTLTELTGSAIAAYEANDATASVEFIASVKI